MRKQLPPSVMLENAIILASSAHKDQLDKAGAPYILHPLRCMMEILSTTGDYEMAAAMVMHDVVEDTNVSIQNMRELNLFNSRIIQLVNYLTRKEGESYTEFIRRCSTNVDASRLKMADLNDNKNLDRLSEITEKDIARWEKYSKAYILLDRVVREHEMEELSKKKKESKNEN